jgi:cytochrome P450
MMLPVGWGPVSSRVAKGAARRMERAVTGITLPTGRIIAARSAAGVPEGPPRDLLDALLKARDPAGLPLAAAEIRDEVTSFLLTGTETSASTLAWALALLSAYPAARERLEAEIGSVLGGREPQASDVSRLPWAKAVVCETMRLFPPAWLTERDALASDVVHGVAVPARSMVVISPYLVHRHPEFWPDPAAFDPRRFMPGESTDAGTRHRYVFIPFGGGRRACVGAAFSELETVLLLAMIASRFRLELTPAGIPPPAGRVSLRPGRALAMRLSRRA